MGWDAPLVDGAWFVQPERLSLYGTPMFDTMSPEQRIELSRHEIASITSMGLWFELIPSSDGPRAYDDDPRSDRAHFSLAEFSDKSRRSMMSASPPTARGPPPGSARKLSSVSQKVGWSVREHSESRNSIRTLW